MANHRPMALHRREVIAELLGDRSDDLLVVAGLGTSSSDVASVEDHPGNFYVGGVMGLSPAIALGLALTQPERRVLLVTGDGDMLMGLGVLASIADQGPRNLGIVILDNESYGETGGQKTATRGGVDLAAIAAGCGFAKTAVAATAKQAQAVYEMALSAPGPVLGVIKVAMESVPRAMGRPRDAGYLKERFRENLLGSDQEPL